MSDDQLKIYERALKRERAARKQAEAILEKKSAELFALTQELTKSNRKLEKLVLEKTSRLKGVFHNIIDAYVVMNIRGDVLEMNEAATKLFGYDLAIEPINVVSLIYKADLKYAMDSYNQLLEHGFFTNYRARIFTKDKQIRWVHINASLIYDEHKKAIGAQGIVRDITENQLSAGIIAEQQKKLSAIVDYSSLAIILTQDGRIIQTNRKAQELLQFTESELIDLHVKDISLKDDHDISVNLMNQMNQEGLDHFVVKKRYIKKDGSKVWAKTSVAAVRNEDGSILYQVALIEDITEQIKNEEDRQSLMQRLEKSNDELQEYAHVVSHDLKSPLRSIYALVEWMKEDNIDSFDQATLQNLALIESTLEKMELLISDVLSFSSVSSGEKKLAPVDINELIEEIRQTHFFPKHISLVIKRPLPTLNVDRVRVLQLFQNLISNAVRYIDKTEGLIEVDAVEKGAFYQFSIGDNGIGIEKQYHQKIFKMFQSLNKSKESTGIGLAIVKKIVDNHQGDIWLESKVGKGSTFFFTLRK
ncbi:MAG: PAS domain S-box protein [Bacteroidetes bacterium]|nr:PAS domain S-box protein [Bacteroidota bacterium]